jgi:uncharacterized protein (DUF983 family)
MECILENWKGTVVVVRKLDKYKELVINNICPNCGNKQLLEFISLNKKSCTDCDTDIDYYIGQNL